MADMQELHTIPSWCSTSTECFEGPPSRKRKGIDSATMSGQKRACSEPPKQSKEMQTESPNDSYASTADVQRAFSQALDINDASDMDLTSSESLDEGSDGEEGEKSVRNASAATLFSEGSSELIHLELKDTCVPELEVSPSKKGYFIPKQVPRGCISAKFADFYHFTPYVISQGTSYFQRLATKDPWLKQAASTLPDFSMFVQKLPKCGEADLCSLPIGGIHRINGEKVWCLAIHLTCIYLAAKVLDTISCAYLLQNMLCHVHHCQVSKEQALELEAEVLMALEWRLGPYFIPNM